MDFVKSFARKINLERQSYSKASSLYRTTCRTQFCKLNFVGKERNNEVETVEISDQVTTKLQKGENKD